jgi:uncharacterized protein
MEISIRTKSLPYLTMNKLTLLAVAGSLCLSSSVFAQDAAPAAPAAAPAAPAAPAATAPAAAAAPAGDAAKVQIGVLPAVMKFDKTEFEVKAGQPVIVLFKNEKCPLQHNIIFIKPGTTDKMAAEAMKAVADPNFMKNNCIPTGADVLFHSNKLIGPGQTDLIKFTAPTEPGDYPYICTFPGHAMLMRGIMKVK